MAVRPPLKTYWQKDVAARTRLDLLARFPNTFCRKRHLKKPLKIGIFEDLVIACPDIKPYAIKFALSDYCNGPTYLAALADGGPRFDLGGNPSGFVSLEEMATAKSLKVLEEYKNQVASPNDGGQAAGLLAVGKTGKGRGFRET